MFESINYKFFVLRIIQTFQAAAEFRINLNTVWQLVWNLQEINNSSSFILIQVLATSITLVCSFSYKQRLFLQAIYLSEYKDATYYISKFSITYVSYGVVLELIINQEGSKTSLCNVMDICGLNLP